MNYMSIGHKVLVHLPTEVRKQQPIGKYHGQEMVITNRVTVGHPNHVYYELGGAVSEPWGIPFAFIKEWLVQL